MIELPYPAAILSPNGRSHWRPKARAFQKHKAWAHTATLTHRNALRGLTGDIAVIITVYPPDSRKRDRDNFIGRCKAYLDGIAYSLGIDDSQFDPRLQWGEPVKGGKVIIHLGDV